jgi:hypothetical protein
MEVYFHTFLIFVLNGAQLSASSPSFGLRAACINQAVYRVGARPGTGVWGVIYRVIKKSLCT